MQPLQLSNDWMLQAMQSMPLEDFNEFQRGWLAGVVTCYEMNGGDLQDARYLAALRLSMRMLSARQQELQSHKRPVVMYTTNAVHVTGRDQIVVV